MCLILFAFEMHPVYRLVLAANRDEFYDRPTAPIHQWQDFPDIIAGRDLKSHGTWLGVTKSGRFSAITNYREPDAGVFEPVSRGDLVMKFLSDPIHPEQYLNTVAKSAHRYKGFNLIVGDHAGMFYFSNRGGGVTRIEPGLHGLSNRFLNTPWHKVRKGKEALGNALKNNFRTEDIFGILADRFCPSDDLLPDTGVGVRWERILAPMFVVSNGYGTRSSSVLLIEKNGRVQFTERTFYPDSAGCHADRTFTFFISDKRS